jgi:tRNA modification GTPase
MAHQQAHRAVGGQGAQLAAAGDPARGGASGKEPPATDTIVAAATASGRGAVAIVRISGPLASRVARAVLGALPAPRVASVHSFLAGDGTPIDHGLALYFPAPHSYTGEDVLELMGHGGVVVVETLIARILELGARRAQAGEFTQRAFLNGKLDLAQAEAVADLIDAGSQAAARAALRSLDGEFSARVHELTEGLIQLRTLVEASIDFAEEEIDALTPAALASQLAALRARLADLQAASRQGRVLTEGMTVALAGRPNAGKSSLLNRLAGYDAAIVTDIPGTTRDVLRERIHIDGMPLHVIDTAGLRPVGGEPLGDAIEAEGIRRATVEFARADRILFVIDAVADPEARAFEEERARLPPGIPVTLLFNKIDLLTPAPSYTDHARTFPNGSATAAEPHRLGLSARTGEGVEALCAHLAQCMDYVPGTGTLSARARHLDALAAAARPLENAALALSEHHAPELVAEELRLAQRALAELTGEVSTEDLLGRIFASFCIGK